MYLAHDMTCNASSMLHQQQIPGPLATMLRPVCQLIGRSGTAAFRNAQGPRLRRLRAVVQCRSHATPSATASAALQKPASAYGWRAQNRAFSVSARAASPEPATATAGSFAPSDDEAPQQQLETVVLDVKGMMCGGCSAAVKGMLLKQPGVEAAAVNLLTETAAVTVKAGGTAEVSAAAAFLTKKGFPSQIRAAEHSELDSDEAQAKRAEEARQSLINLGFAWALVVLCCSHHFGHLMHMMGYHQFAHTSFMNFMSQPVVSGALGAFALLGPGRSLLVDGLKSLWAGAPNMNSLVAIGSTTSFTVGAAAALVPQLGFDSGFMEEPVMLLAFVLLGRALEARAKVRAASDLKALAKLIPTNSRLVLDPGDEPGSDSSHVRENVEMMMVPTTSVRPGDILRVLPGERVPCDAEVLEGIAAVDESMLTGESVLVAKRTGLQVAGGCVVYEGPLTIKTTATGAESTLAGIGRLVAAAQSREAPMQRVADAVAGKFCYGVMAASAATFTFWQTLGQHLFPAAIVASGSSSALLLSIKLAVDVLVVACPCALGLATPTAVLVGSSLGATRGLLMRGGDVLERVAGISGVVFDKTGTLTEGKLRLATTAVVPGAAAAVAESLQATLQNSGSSNGKQQSNGNGSAATGDDGEGLLLRIAAAVEASTRHPLAAALAAEASSRCLKLPAVTEAKTEPGSGVAALVGGQRVLVGRPDWVLSQLPPTATSASPQLSQTTTDQAGKLTSVYVSVGDQLLGGLGFRDTLRPDAVETVRTLQQMGLRVFLLSGDDTATVKAVAAQAGIAAEDAYGSNTPREKLEVIRRLQASSMKLAMVGDGVNDAPALAAADVGIALKGGLDAAGEAASVVLMGDRLSQVVDCITLGQATLYKIKQNLAWALMYNVVGIPLAAGALLPSMGVALNPSAAGGMMAFSSVAVVSNSLLLRAQYMAAAARRHLRGSSGSSSISAEAAGSHSELTGAAGRV